MTDNNRPDDLCAVTDADRKMAASFYQRHLSRPGEVPVAAAMRVGHIDESPLIQSFARHRFNATTDQSAEIARLRAALEDAGTRISGLSFAPVFDPESASINGKEVIRARSIGRQMLAALNTKDADR